MGKIGYLLIVPIFKFLICLNHSLYLRKALKIHGAWLSGVSETATDNEKLASEKAAKWITANQLEIKRRVESLGLDNPTNSYMKPIGWGHVQQQEIGALDNLLFVNMDILKSARHIIKIAEGAYWTKAWLSLNPLYWIEIIVFLPRELVKTVGFHRDSKFFTNFMNVIQLTYWILMIVYTLYLLSTI